ncbi:MAG: alpha/beta fold hydrolase [Actinobacteria bacterium]|nr:alpha/beta fold hydrolase [Actinomycetota bacterium]MCB9413173.1 alpha/beta fold hydrolase [Actinomycetota bacterium]
MRPQNKVVALVVVTIITALAAVWLNLTSASPEVALAGGNTDAATEPPFDASEGVAPTAFYDPPDPLPDQPPGTVLRAEEISDAPEGAAAWRLLYLSVDNAGNPIAISGLYVEPTTPPAEGNRFPLVGFAHGTTGVGRECGMSQAPFEDKTPGNEYWRTLIGPMVAAGNAVFATDYEGMGAPGNYTYLLRKQAFDVLDGMRAALFFRPQTLDALNLAVLGHSEGGYVALATADQAADYAPELAIKGAVSQAPGGIPPIPAALNALLGSTGDSGPTPRSGYVTDLSQSWIQTYPDISSPEDWYTEVGATEIPAAAELCQGAQLAALDQPFHTYFNRSVPVELSRIPAMEQPMYNTSAIPILIQQGSEDTSVVPQVSRAMAVQGCALGNLVDYQEFPNDVHRSVQYTSRTQYLEWLAARFTGQPVDDSCRGW